LTVAFGAAISRRKNIFRIGLHVSVGYNFILPLGLTGLFCEGCIGLLADEDENIIMDKG